MKFIVDRQKWYRGRGADDSKLLREDGTRCCIGFVGQQCGLSDERLSGESSVFGVPNDRWPKWMIGYTSSVVAAYVVNDDKKISDEKREFALKKIFSENGDEIEFVN
jgi:hypothetical protein